jgi:hypothetical protein
MTRLAIKGLIQVDDRKLYQIIDFILNKAESPELEVIRSALRKREGGDPSEEGTTFGQKIGKMSRDMSQSVSGQVGVSEDQIRSTIRGFVTDMIRREAPELRETQVEELLDEWVPDPKTAGRKGSRPKSGAGKALPPDALLTMIRQFVAHGTGKMTVAEETDLSAAVPGWQQRYWARFSQVTRKLISLYIKGIMAERDFWSGIYDEIGLDATGSSSET